MPAEVPILSEVANSRCLVHAEAAQKHSNDANTLLLLNFDSIYRDILFGYYAGAGSSVAGYALLHTSGLENSVGHVGLQDLEINGQSASSGVHMLLAFESFLERVYITNTHGGLKMENNCYSSTVRELTVLANATATCPYAVMSLLSSGATSWDSISIEQGVYPLVVAGGSMVMSNVYIVGSYMEIGAIFSGTGAYPVHTLHNFGVSTEASTVAAAAAVAFSGNSEVHWVGATDMTKSVMNTEPSVIVSGGGKHWFQLYNRNRSTQSAVINIASAPQHPIEMAGAFTNNNVPLADDLRWVRLDGRSPVYGLTLASGNNNDLAVGASEFVRVTGPTAAFTITGLAAPPLGVGEIRVLNATTQTMSIAHEDTGSAAANRVETRTGATVTVGGQYAVATLRYDAVASRWVLVATN